MSEQKMPALPSPEYYGLLHGEPYWSRETVRRIQREAYEAGRQHERERLEPLRVAQEAAREAARRHLSTRSDDDFKSLLEAHGAVVGAVITLLETDR